MRRRIKMAEKARENANIGTGSARKAKKRFVLVFLIFSPRFQFRLIG